MGKYTILTDKDNTYFSKNKITIGSNKPSVGTWTKGDIVISNTPSAIFGWICTEGGTPGTWNELKSASGMDPEYDHNHNNLYYQKSEVDEKVSTINSSISNIQRENQQFKSDNTYFSKNKITIGSNKPSVGAWNKGDIVISNNPSASFGWICTVQGTPGTWIELKSATGIVADHNHDDKYYQKSEVDGKISPINSSISSIQQEDADFKRKNTYFNSNKITISESKPSNGTWAKGDFVLSSSPSNEAFGWICTGSGTPGTWKALKSGGDITKKEINMIITGRPDGDISNHKHKLSDITELDEHGNPIGNNYNTPLGAIYYRGDTTNSVGRITTRKDQSSKDFTGMSLCDKNSGEMSSEFRLYSDNATLSTSLEIEGDLTIKNHHMYFSESTPSSPEEGDIWFVVLEPIH